MSSEALLARLKKVKRVGQNRWKACCPCHDDQHPSLNVRETESGTVLIHCLACGAGAMDVIGVLRLDPGELFPPREIGHQSPIRNPVFRPDVFEFIRQEIRVVNVVACDIHANKVVSERDYQRLAEAASRLARIAEASYGS